MAWNKSLPADATKLRLSASIIRSNWDAIETGGVPYTKLQLAKQAVNPTRQNSTGWLFTKDPGTGFSELYYEDDRNPAKVLELTSNGRLGNSTATAIIQNLTFNGTYNNTQAAMVSAYARCGSAGGVTYGNNIASCTRTGTGNYTIVTSAVFNNANVSVQLTSYQASSDTPAGITVLSDPTFAAGQVSFDVEIKNRSGSAIDRKFFVVVCGGI